MTLLDLGDVLVDEETGELFDAAQTPIAGPDLSLLAWRLRDAGDQKRAWERAEMALKGVFLNLQDERKAIYGDVVISIRTQQRSRFLPAAWRQVLDAESFNRIEYRAIALAITGIDASRLTPELGRFVEAATDRYETKPFVVTDTVRRAGPVVRK